MLAEYHFKIKHIKRSDNARADTLNRKKELQRNDKMSRVLFKESSNKRIKYNHPQLSGTHKALVSSQTQRIQETQSKDENLEDYTSQEVIYIFKNITREFIKEFYRNLTQGYNRTTALVRKLEKEYIIYKIHIFAR